MVVATRSRRNHQDIQEMIFKEKIKKEIREKTTTTSSKDLKSAMLGLIKKENKMLGDEVVNMALRKICSCYYNNTKKYVFINSFLPLLGECSFNRFELDLDTAYVIPIFLTSPTQHWRLCVVFKGVAYIYDSIKWPEEDSQFITKKTMEMVYNVFVPNTSFIIIHLNGPIQRDDTSCGLYVIAACDLILKDIRKGRENCLRVFNKKGFRIKDEHLARIQLAQFLIGTTDRVFK